MMLPRFPSSFSLIAVFILATSAHSQSETGQSLQGHAQGRPESIRSRQELTPDPVTVLTPAAIMEQHATSIVAIGRLSHGSFANVGTGFFVDEHGRVATNYHVVEGLSEVVVKTPQGAMVRAREVLCANSDWDLAILDTSIESSEPLPFATELPRVGETIVVIGNPQGYKHSITDGLVSAVRRDIEGVTNLQISAPVSPGSSGSPVFNQRGEVVGVVTKSRLESQNLNFAIAVDNVDTMVRHPAPESLPLPAVFASRSSGESPGGPPRIEVGTESELRGARTVYVYADISNITAAHKITRILTSDGSLAVVNDINEADVVLLYGSRTFTIGATSYTWEDFFGGIHSSSRVNQGVNGVGIAVKRVPDGGLRVVWTFSDMRTTAFERSPSTNFARNFIRTVHLASSGRLPRRDRLAAGSGYGPISPASLAFGLGPSAPVGDLNQMHDVGRSLSASMEYKLSELIRCEILSVTYDHFALDASEISKVMGSGLDTPVSGGSAGIVSVGAGVQLRARPYGFSPYMTVGVGVYRTWIEDTQFTIGHSSVELPGAGETSFGYHIGGGFEALIGENSGIYFDLRMRIALTEEEATFFAPFRSGLRFYM